MSLESTKELLLMAPKIDKNFDGKLTCASKKSHEEYIYSYIKICYSKFLPEHFQKSKIWVFDPTWKMYEIKSYRGIIYHDNEK